MTWVIRIPESTDADACAELHVRTWQEAYSHLLPDDFFTPAYADSRRQMWDRMLREPPVGAELRLLDAVLGDDPAMLWVAERNPRAIRFYERNGFALDGARREEASLPLLSSVRMVR